MDARGNVLDYVVMEQVHESASVRKRERERERKRERGVGVGWGGVGWRE